MRCRVKELKLVRHCLLGQRLARDIEPEGEDEYALFGCAIAMWQRAGGLEETIATIAEEPKVPSLRSLTVALNGDLEVTVGMGRKLIAQALN